MPAWNAPLLPPPSPEGVSGEQFPLSEKGGRLLCSAFAFPRLNCSRREVLKLVSAHTQLLATPGRKPGRTEALALSRIGKRLSQQQGRCGFGWAVFESAGFPKTSAIFDQPLPKHEQGHEGR